MEDKADLDIEAYLYYGDKRGPLCDVRVWLPRHPDADGMIEATVLGVDAHKLGREKPVSLRAEHASFLFEATNLLIRTAESTVGRTLPIARLNIEYIDRLTVRRASSEQTDGKLPALKSVMFSLSSFNYALKRQFLVPSYRGDVTLDPEATPLRLKVAHSSGYRGIVDVDRHWHWVFKREGTSLVGESFPVLKFLRSEKGPLPDLSVLRQCADDTALLISLAARRRVAVHGLQYSAEDHFTEEWTYPLSRTRATGLENPRDRLIADTELSSFVEAASEKLMSLPSASRGAVELAIVSINPTSERTTEARYISTFTALEALATQFSGSAGTLLHRVSALFNAHPPQISGLWPVAGPKNLPGLYRLRNALAHGESFSRQAPGALSIASDHLKLWIEYVLLAILGGKGADNSQNWSAHHAVTQATEVKSARELLGTILT